MIVCFNLKLSDTTDTCLLYSRNDCPVQAVSTNIDPVVTMIVPLIITITACSCYFGNSRCPPVSIVFTITGKDVTKRTRADEVLSPEIAPGEARITTFQSAVIQGCL